MYFTCNALPGGIYAYKLGDDAAQMIFTPDAKYREYCTASIICDEKGNLYYANDSGRLFKLAGAESWRVAFDAQGGSYVAPRYVAKNKMVSEPAAPTRDGYTFLGWYTAEGEKWDFAKDVVTADMTLYAKWTKNEASSPDTDNAGGKKDNAACSRRRRAAMCYLLRCLCRKARFPKAMMKKADDQKSAKASDAKSSSKAENDTATKSAAAVDDGASSTESAPIWPYIVLAVGVAGLAAATVWFVVARRKRDGDE